PYSLVALTATTVAPGATARTASSGRYSAASALVSTTTGCACDSQASASIRSIRPRSTSPSAAVQTSTVSTLAASTCARESRDAVDRTIADRRGNSLRTVIVASMSTQ